MERNGALYIGINSLKGDYLNLNLDLRSSNDDWDKAIKIFEDRIEGRFFSVIDVIKNRQNYNQDGFAIMALECLLIETLMQFREGYDMTPRGVNKDKYATFLMRELPEVFPNKTIAEIFYTDIRCGILHSAETKNGSQLTFNKEDVVERINSNTISVDVEKMTNRVREYYYYYIEELREGNNNILRDNFLKKMDSICNKN